jgi:hypothetical protein
MNCAGACERSADQAALSAAGTSSGVIGRISIRL